MFRKTLATIAVLGLMVGTPYLFGAIAGSQTDAPCVCCGDACTCVDCVCDENGCACSDGGNCYCTGDCGATCCAD